MEQYNYTFPNLAEEIMVVTYKPYYETWTLGDLKSETVKRLKFQDLLKSNSNKYFWIKIILKMTNNL